ncbi:antibiotic biosynthesis monooxygenase [Streptomyces sp. NBC_00210]|uniref:antibiotic biosynthesis monooxygenase family protein n=1 Tax=unclassified Streptomyces TaxID=2593676 RepID=UPI00324AE2C8
MAEDTRYWASGSWHVTDGKADEFIERWTEFLTWTKQANEGFLTARLVHDLSDPNHFVSFAAWRDLDSLSGWREKPEFERLFGGCRALCTNMHGSNYEVAVVV